MLKIPPLPEQFGKTGWNAIKEKKRVYSFLSFQISQQSFYMHI